MTAKDADRRERPSSLITWALAVVVPILAGAAAWLLSDATVSASACAGRGGGAGGAELAELVLLVLAGPGATAWRARRAITGRSMFPVVLSLFLSLITVYMGLQLWWIGHNCMT